MSFGVIQFTNRGRALQAKAQAGAQLNFTRIAVGDGQLAGQSISDLTALIHLVKSLTINKFKTMPGGKAAAGGVLSNQDIVTGFWWREIGLFAMDPDLGEILYCYGNAGELAEYIPSPGGAEILEKQVDIITIVGNAGSISATIEQSLVYASAQELIEHEADTNAHGVGGKISKSLATGADQVLVSSGAGTWIVKTIAQLKSWLGLGSAAYTDSTNYAASNHTHTAADVGAAPAGHNHDTAYAAKTLETTVNTHLSDYTLQIPWGGTTTNSGNVYSLALPVISALTAGMAVCFKCNADSSGTVSLNWNGKGNKSVLKANGLAVTSWKSGGVYTVRYDGTNFQLQGEGGDYGNATPSDVKSGVTFGTETGLQIGTSTAKRWQSATMSITAGVGTVTGLPFTPSVVMVINQTLGYWNCKSPLINACYDGSTYKSTSQITVSGNSFTVTSSNFNSANSTNYTIYE